MTMILGTELSSTMPECPFGETLPSDGGEATGRGPKPFLHLFCVQQFQTRKQIFTLTRRYMIRFNRFFFLCSLGRDDECVRGPVWCQDSTGEGGHCCNREDCSLDDVRLLPDPENDYSQR